MRWNLRILMFGIGLVVIVFALLQLIEVTNQFNRDSPREITVREHAQNIMLKTCRDSFPVPDGVRIFPDGREVRHIAFLKVHKAASGTATSILFRFGMSRGLTFILPKWLNIVSSSETLQEKLIHPRLNKSFDIMTSHVIFNKSAFENFLPKDTVYIGIIREPYQQFKSSMNYMAPKYVYNISKEDPIQRYLKDPLKYETAKIPRFSWINNRQATEFGTPDDIIVTRNKTAMADYVNKLDSQFHLVIISEYFDESIILFRRMLNWRFEDILYRRLHIRGWDRKLTIPRANDRKLYKRYAFADYAIYDFFYRRLWQQISRAGNDFFDEVLHFKQARDEVDDFCKTFPNITDTYVVEKSIWNKKLTVDKTFCGQLFAEEEDWVQKIGLKQYNIQPKKKS
ncbi:hypothetical protein ACF0H5_018996 [Mactra antiquata]